MTHRDFEEIQKEIKLFRVGDYDWIAAKNETDAKTVMAGLLGETLESYEREYDDQTKELSVDDMNRLRYFDDGDNGKLTKSFRERLDELILAKTEFPKHFASTEF